MCLKRIFKNEEPDPVPTVPPPPVEPTPTLPTYKRWSVAGHYLIKKLEKMGMKTFPSAKQINNMKLDEKYTYTNLDGWAEVIPHLITKSDLYRKNIFDCEDYAVEAQSICAKNYGLNAVRLCVGTIPSSTDPNKPAGHGFNILFYGDDKGVEGVLLFEPNAGFAWAGNAFEIGENDYQPVAVFIN